MIKKIKAYQKIELLILYKMKKFIIHEIIIFKVFFVDHKIFLRWSKCPKVQKLTFFSKFYFFLKIRKKLIFLITWIIFLFALLKKLWSSQYYLRDRCFSESKEDNVGFQPNFDML